MNFGNNIEKMGFEKSGWSLIEVSPDGQTIYQGRTFNPNALLDEPVWLIKRISIVNGKDNSQTFVIEYSISNKNKWEDRKTLRYVYF